MTQTDVKSLQLTDEEQMLASSANALLAEQSPVSAFRALRDSGHSWDPALWKTMAEMGWTGVLAPESCGGSDIGHSAAGLLSRAMGNTLVASPFISTAVIAASALRQQATDRARESLAAIVAGDLRYALAIDEGNKHAPGHTAMVAERSGNGYRLQGDKTFVVDGGIANRILVLARTAGAPGDQHGLTLFDLHIERLGISAELMDTVDYRDAARLNFNAVEATGDDIIGDPDNGLAALSPALVAGQAAVAAEMTGVAAGAFGMTVSYLKERRQFGLPIGSFQALQHRAAKLWCDIELTASAILKAGRVLDTDTPNAALFVSLAKARAAGTVKLAVTEGVQMHGGMGMTDEFDMGFYMKRARVSTEWLGDYSYHAENIARIRGF